MRRSMRRACIAIGLMFAALVPGGLPGVAGATFPGTNGRIAFNDYITGQIYAVNADGTGLVQLTHVDVDSGAFASSPAWSPDGEHIAFVSNMSGPWRLWIMENDGSNLRKVVKDAAGVNLFTPTYTPNGRRLLYTRCQEPLGCALFSVRTDGTDSRALTPLPFDSADLFPSVSPDGRMIAFTRFNAHGIIAQVQVMRANGSGLHALTPPGLEAYRPDWSPDGRHITFTSHCCPLLGSNVYVMNADGSGLHRLTAATFPNDAFASSYSPDGDSIVFADDRRYDDYCCSDLFVMTASGSQETRIRTVNIGVDNPTWGSASPIAASVAASSTIRSVGSEGEWSTRADWCRALPQIVREAEGCRQGEWPRGGSLLPTNRGSKP